MGRKADPSKPPSGDPRVSREEILTVFMSQERPQKSRKTTGYESEKARPGELDYK